MCCCILCHKLSAYRLEEEIGLQLAFEEGSSKYFPASNSALEVRDHLLAACLRRGVTIRYNAELIDLAQKEDVWTCFLGDKTTLESQKVVKACCDGLEALVCCRQFGSIMSCSQ